MADIGAVILAGGLARRMGGQDKGLVMLGDKPMVHWALDTVADLTSDIAINANRNHKTYEAFGKPVIGDLHEGHLGPLAGLYAAMQTLTNQHIFMCPCDSPFLQRSLLSKLQQAVQSSQADICVAHDGERLQPVFAMVSSELSASLNDFLNSGQRKIDKWYSHHNMLSVDCSDCQDSFRNINTEEERQAAEQELI